MTGTDHTGKAGAGGEFRDQVVKEGMFPTPSAMDGERGASKGGTEKHRGGVNLREACNCKSPNLGVQAHRELFTAGQEEGNPCNTTGKNRGLLNSRWVAQLQGYPSNWCDLPIDTLSALTATRLSRKSPK